MKDFNKKFLDCSDWHNKLSHEKIINAPSLISEEDYFSDMYQVQFKKGFWGKLFLSHPLTITLLGEYGNTEYSRILLEVKTQDKQKVGIVDVFFGTVVPIDYTYIDLINIGKHTPLFVCYKLPSGDECQKIDIFTLSGKKIISDISSFEITKTSEFTYKPKKKDCKICDLSYTLTNDNERVNSILLKKTFDIHSPEIGQLLKNVEDIETTEREACWHYRDEGKRKLRESIAYCLARDIHDAEESLTMELVVDTELFHDPNLKRFKELYKGDHSHYCDLFFDDDAFLN